MLKKIYFWFKVRELKKAVKVYNVYLEDRKGKKAGTQNFKTWANLMLLTGNNLMK